MFELSNGATDAGLRYQKRLCCLSETSQIRRQNGVPQLLKFEFRMSKARE
jgi:hypothetical protein